MHVVKHKKKQRSYRVKRLFSDKKLEKNNTKFLKETIIIKKISLNVFAHTLIH